MPASPSAPADSPASEDVAALEGALTRISYLLNRTRRHEQVSAAAGVPLDRAAAVVLRQLAEAGAMRPGELAAQLQVEPPHITRQVQRLAKVGYAHPVPDPGDRRAHVIQLTPSGRAAADRLRETGRAAMRAALAHWSPQEVHQLATLLHRMVDDFLAYRPEEEGEQPAGPAGQGAVGAASEA